MSNDDWKPATECSHGVTAEVAGSQYMRGHIGGSGPGYFVSIWATLSVTLAEAGAFEVRISPPVPIGPGPARGVAHSPTMRLVPAADSAGGWFRVSGEASAGTHTVYVTATGEAET
jgi:hypothetical protein